MDLCVRHVWQGQGYSQSFNDSALRMHMIASMDAHAGRLRHLRFYRLLCTCHCTSLRGIMLDSLWVSPKEYTGDLLNSNFWLQTCRHPTLWGYVRDPMQLFYMSYFLRSKCACMFVSSGIEEKKSVR